MNRFSDVLGVNVVSAATAERLGTVAGLVVDPAAGAVVAVRVGGGAADVVGWDDVRGVGPDAVVVSSDGALRMPRPGIEERSRSADTGLIGKRALTDAGTEVGTVADVEFDAETGRLHALLVGDRRLPGDGVRGVGPYAVVVRDSGLEAPPATAPS